MRIGLFAATSLMVISVSAVRSQENEDLKELCEIVQVAQLNELSFTETLPNQELEIFCERIDAEGLPLDGKEVCYPRRCSHG